MTVRNIDLQGFLIKSECFSRIWIPSEHQVLKSLLIEIFSQYLLIPVITQISIYQLTFIRHRIWIHSIHIWSLFYWYDLCKLDSTSWTHSMIFFDTYNLTGGHEHLFWREVSVCDPGDVLQYRPDPQRHRIRIHSTFDFFYSYDPTGDREKLLWRDDCICDSYCMFKKSCLF